MHCNSAGTQGWFRRYDAYLPPNFPPLFCEAIMEAFNVRVYSTPILLMRMFSRSLDTTFEIKGCLIAEQLN